MAFKYSFLWAALACTVMLVNSYPNQHNIQKRGSIRLCGSRLVEALGVVCSHIYPDPPKRNYVYSGDSIPSWENSFSEPDAFVRPQTALDFFSISNVPRNTRGIVDECCRKACTIQELLSYCG
ncbi:LIRP-like [Stegodyphus dumicola]|uniref:LIRP-like n=1 Tax=Stegodyphus dumicola TaxID=202533 RepID=UPI0015AE491B|nr:LIRP-like [Stegodyphus dumicola]